MPPRPDARSASGWDPKTFGAGASGCTSIGLICLLLFSFSLLLAGASAGPTGLALGAGGCAASLVLTGEVWLLGSYGQQLGQVFAELLSERLPSFRSLDSSAEIELEDAARRLPRRATWGAILWWMIALAIIQLADWGGFLILPVVALLSLGVAVRWTATFFATLGLLELTFRQDSLLTELELRPPLAGPQTTS